MIFSRKPIFILIVFCASVLLFQSCVPRNKFLFVFNRTSVKHPPKDTFVFANEIHIQPGIISKDEQNRLETVLNDYWDDSVKARSIQQFGVFYRIKEPQRFDTFALERSRIFMNSYLQSQGYYNAVLTDTFRIDTFKSGTSRQQFRAVPIMMINTGKRLKIDSVAFNFIDTIRPSSSDTILQQLAMQKSNETLLKKNDPYSKEIVGKELDRLVNWYRQNGYYKLNRDNLVAVVDTTEQLIDSLTIDPFVLTRRITEAVEKRKNNPTADIEIMQATKAKTIPFDSGVVTRYHIGNIYYYPEVTGTEIPDTLLKKNQFNTQQTGNIFMKFPGATSRFRSKPLVQHTYITKGELYNERYFYKTINTLGQMGPWQQVEIRDSLRKDTVDFHIFLTPYKKKNFKSDLELTRSTSDFIASNNLFGIGGNITFLNRNVFKLGWQASTSARAGVEFNLQPGEQLLQTVQGGFGQSFIIPHMLFTSAERQKKYDAARAVINFNVSYTERRNFFRLRSATINVGNEKVVNNHASTFRFLNIELYSLDTLPELIKAFQSNPFLRTAFNTGSVLSMIKTGNYTWSGRLNKNHSNYFRYGAEYAGLMLPVIIPETKKSLYHYIKAEVELIQKWQKLKSEKVVRFFAGAGYNLTDTGKSLPFFKQFVAGGPNSMRAWGLRQLGLGRSKLNDTSTSFNDRFGDLQLEANGEWRFYVGSAGSAKFSSAVFTDIGNIWNLKADPTNPEAQFKLQNLYRDLAIALGTGLRVNVANFLFRIDFALKLKDPARTENGGWLPLKKFTWKNENDRNNYAFQVGIGLPF